MKKLFLYAAMFSAGLLTAACSSEEVEQVNPNREGLLSYFDQNGNAYLTVRINTPTEGYSTRAAGYKAEEGTAEEYAINEGILLLFNGTSESEATFLKAYQMTISGSEGTTSPGEVDHKWAVVPISGEGLTGGDNLYAYVIANANGYFKFDNDVLKYKNGENYENVSGTFADVAAIALPLASIPETSTGEPIKKGIIMTNTPLSKNQGDTQSPNLAADNNKIWYMPTIQPENIFKTLDDAIAAGDNALDIFVERTAAKVGLIKDASLITLKDKDAITIKAIEWAIDNRVTDFSTTRLFIADSIGDLNMQYSSATGTKFRFVSPNKITYKYWTNGDRDNDGNTSRVQKDGDSYRINWANSKYHASTIAQKKAAMNSNLSTWLSADKADSHTNFIYIPEHTLPSNEMYQSVTTRMVVRAQFNDGKSFYTSNIEGNDDIYKDEGTNKGFNLIKNKVVVWLKGLPAYNSSMGDLTVKFFKADGTTEITPDPTEGIEISKFKVEGTGLSDGNALENFANANLKVRFYKDGWAHYKVMLRHFASGIEVKAPVTDGGSGYNEVYPCTSTDNRKADYLGSYSVVRNTWYDYTLEDIKHIGQPTVPDIPTTEKDIPDDEVESYLSFKINVMKWAKKSHSIHL